MIYETLYRESGICEMNFFVIIFWILAFFAFGVEI